MRRSAKRSRRFRNSHPNTVLEQGTRCPGRSFALESGDGTAGRGCFRQSGGQKKKERPNQQQTQLLISLTDADMAGRQEFGYRSAPLATALQTNPYNLADDARRIFCALDSWKGWSICQEREELRLNKRETRSVTAHKVFRTKGRERR